MQPVQLQTILCFQHSKLHCIRYGQTVPCCCLVQGWQLKLTPLQDGPLKGSSKLGSKVTSQPVPAKEYGADLPFRLPLPNRSADDVVLALCAGQGGGGAVPADDR